jgi:hypothetical protein
MGPLDQRENNSKVGYTPNDYGDIFREMNVKKVIRLNEIKYDRYKFIE